MHFYSVHQFIYKHMYFVLSEMTCTAKVYFDVRFHKNNLSPIVNYYICLKTITLIPVDITVALNERAIL